MIHISHTQSHVQNLIDFGLETVTFGLVDYAIVEVKD